MFATPSVLVLLLVIGTASLTQFAMANSEDPSIEQSLKAMREKIWTAGEYLQSAFVSLSASEGTLKRASSEFNTATRNFNSAFGEYKESTTYSGETFRSADEKLRLAAGQLKRAGETMHRIAEYFESAGDKFKYTIQHFISVREEMRSVQRTGENFKLSDEPNECVHNITNVLKKKCSLSCINRAHLEEFQMEHGVSVAEYCCHTQTQGSARRNCFDDDRFAWRFCCELPYRDCVADFKNYTKHLCNDLNPVPEQNGIARTCEDPDLREEFERAQNGTLLEEYCCGHLGIKICKKSAKFVVPFCCTKGKKCCKNHPYVFHRCCK